MKIQNILNFYRWLVWVFVGSLSLGAHAEAPLWTFSAPNPALQTVRLSGTSIIQYTVTNQSSRPKSLVLRTAMPGVSAPVCNLSGKGSTCVLNITVQGNLLPAEGIRFSPVLCMGGNPNQCYGPGTPDQVQVRVLPDQGQLSLTASGMQVSSLVLGANDNATLVLKNTGLATVRDIAVSIPLAWQAYFTNQCPSELEPNQTCNIDYTIPAIFPPGSLKAFRITATNSSNEIYFPMTVQPVGGLSCWGWNVFGQLGSAQNVGSNTPNDAPLALASLAGGVVAIGGGYGHTCALLSDNSVSCWGRNNAGQLGYSTNYGTDNANITPAAVVGLGLDNVALAVGYSHTCALSSAGNVYCWGANGAGQLGTSVAVTPSTYTPMQVQGLTNVTAIAAGGDHTCALTRAGGVKCWGSNVYGQLGNNNGSGASTPIIVPQDVQGLTSEVDSIVAGAFHTCALLRTGAVKCWGRNWFGQLGSTTNSGSSGNPNPTPLDVQTLSSGVQGISAGFYFTCATMADGSAKCWGFNQNGQLGVAAYPTGPGPYSVPGTVQTLNPGDVIYGVNSMGSSCALLSTGGGKCWGWNLYGQLGNPFGSGSNGGFSVPLDIQVLGTSIKAMSSGLGVHTCAIS